MFRKLIFSKGETFKNLKEPKQYADQEWDVNYWKLTQMWGISKPPYPNPLVGWGFEFWQKTLLHPDIEQLNKRRPVLIYGDSFANCIDSTQCYEEYLNNDSVFSENNFLINYGTGGYGVDQIYTLMKNSYQHYENPFVVFSFLTFDMDRSGLSFREGQKPYYTLDDNGELKLNTSGFNPSPAEYLNENPPQIKSYAWKKFLYSDINFLPESLTQSLKGESQQREFLKKLNTKLLHEAAKELKESGVDFIFLIFEGYVDYNTPRETNWRVKLISDILEKENIPHVWARDLIKNDLNPDLKNLDKFLIPGDGHPTSYFNRIVSDEIKRQVLTSEQKDSTHRPEKKSFYYVDLIDSAIQKLKSSESDMNEVRRLAKERNLTEAVMLKKHAMYLMWDKGQ